MNWIFVGTLLGALVTSTHDNREACEGKAVVLREKGVAGRCEEAPRAGITGFTTFSPATR